MDGSSGTTRDELLKAFRITESNKSSFDESQRALLNKLGAIPGQPIHVPSAVFLVWPVVLDKAFVERSGRRYDAVVAKVGGATIEAKRMMNEWVRDQTDGRIQDLVTAVTTEDAVFVINIVHFQDMWASPFQRSRTKVGVFHAPHGDVEASLMSRSDLTSVASDATFDAVVLGYNSPGLVFVALLPKEGTSIDDAMDRMSGKQWRKLWSSRKPRPANITLPRFSFESEYDLIPSLRALGLKTMFSNEANFRNMSVEMERGFFVRLMKHRAVIDVDEEGTVASAATVAAIAGAADPNPPVEFRADRPFAYAIVEASTGTICLFGVVNDPTRRD
jgi:serpin B